MLSLLTDQISLTIFEKGQTRNISTKLFQNLTNGFREGDFLRICSYLYSERSPHSLEPCLMTEQISLTFLRKVTQEHFCEIISKSDHLFRRRRFFKNFFMSVECKKPPFTTAMFIEGSKFRKQFLKRVTQGTFL